MLKLIRAIITRDLRLAMRRRADIVSALFFFIQIDQYRGCIQR